MSTKNLGLFIDSTLSWNPYLSHAMKRVWFILRQLKRSHSLLLIEVRKLLIQSLIFPIFDYCCLAITDLTFEQKRKLQVLFNSCVRFVFCLNMTVHISPYLIRLGWLTLENRRHYFMATLTYALLANNTPEYLISHMLKRSFFFAPRLLRCPHMELIVPYFATRVYENSFMVLYIKFWNEIPESMRRSANINIFKTKLFDFLLQKQIAALRV